ISNSFPKDETYNLVSQIRRSTLSIPTNIAEGCGRNSDKEFNQFLNIALGSATETEYLILLAKDLNYLNEENYLLLDQQINTIKSKIYTLKNKLIQQ
ncbi:four helix bundle protein, partial [Algoriella sp.]